MKESISFEDLNASQSLDIPSKAEEPEKTHQIPEPIKEQPESSSNV